jgi:hypothetical protein
MYHVITAKDTPDLDEEVMKYIKDGWKPQGGVCAFVTLSGHDYYCQAMVKDIEP